MISTVATGTAPLVVTSTTQIANANVATAGNLVNGNSNVVVTGNGNITFASAGNAAIFTVTGTGANISGTANVSGNANVGNLGTATIIATTGNITTINSGLLQNGNSNVTITANGNIGHYVTGNTTSQLTITATGANIAGTANIVGNANVGNLGFGSGVITGTGNITAGNIIGIIAAGSNTITTTGNANVGNLGFGSGIITGTGNITAGNIIGIIAAGSNTITTTGNANVGNLGTTGLIASGNIQSNNTVLANAINSISTSGFTVNAVGTNSNINLVTNGTGNVILSNTYINNVATPLNLTDAATKGYVDSVAQGLSIKQSVVAATTTDLGTVTYNNGTSGVGATLTNAGTQAAFVIDGVTVPVTSRVLIKNESNAAYNGIYVVTTAGSGSSNWVLTRTNDFNTSAEIVGGFTFVEQGTINADTGWVNTNTGTVTVGTTNITFTQFSGAGTYTAGTGLTLTGTQFSITSTAVTSGTYGNGDRVATFTVNSQGQLTAASNTAITANAANLTGTTLNSSIVTSSLTSVGTLGSLSVTGNIGAGNVNAALFGAHNGTVGATTANTGAFTTISASGQITSTVATGTAPFAVSSTTQVANLNSQYAGTANTVAGANVTGTVSLANNASYLQGYQTASPATATTIALRDSSGNLYANYVYGNGSTLSSITGANVTGAVGLATYATTANAVAGANVSGAVAFATTANAVAAANITGSTLASGVTGSSLTSVGTLGTLTVTGNISSTANIGGTGATHLGNTFTTGSNTTTGVFTGNFSLSAGSRLNATYADLAEKYVSDAEYAPGTVLVFGGEQEVTLANTFDSTRVAGVVTTNPAYTMNNDCQGEHVVNVALQGRVPVLVSGNVAKGDLMVSGANGRAIANNEARAGTIIGKALANFTGTEGTIEVAVGRF